jgi:hypothetical protein
MTTEVQDILSATKEINDWLDVVGVRPTRREICKGQIDTLVEAMQYGDISISNGVIKQTLVNPVTELDLTTLEYKNRLSIGDKQKVATGSKIDATDFTGQTIATIAALTGKGYSHISKLSMPDYKIGEAIAIFFM